MRALSPVRANAGIEASYRRKLDRLIKEMSNSVIYWTRAAYRENEPEIAMDASPARALSGVVRALRRRWQKKFDEVAPALAEWFSQSVADRSYAALKSILKKGGFSVDFKLTRAMNDVVQASVQENVSLIKSIPSEYFTQVEGIVMRSVSVGRDLSTLTNELQQRYAITRRRAKLIANDQSAKATATITRARQLDLGITKAIWQHSSAGKEPRPSHVAYSGKEFDIAKGAYIDGKWIQPGSEINCRCTSRPILPF